MSNEDVSSDKLLSCHWGSLVARSNEESEVLVVGDTTELSFGPRPGTQGLGPLKHKNQLGLLAHASYVVTPDRRDLGIADIHYWARKAKDHGKRRERSRTLPTKKKESRKWLESLNATRRLREAITSMKTEVTAVFDREGDVFAVIAEAMRTPGIHLLVRSQFNRACAETEWRPELWEHVAATPHIGSMSVEVPKTPTHPARTARLSLKLTSATLRQHRHMKSTESIDGEPTIWIVLAEEIDPPPRVEKIEWRLVTTRPTLNYDDAVRCVRHYAARWAIEVFFSAWKAALKTTDRQLRTAARLKRILTIDAMTAWIIRYLLTQARQQPQEPCTSIFTTEQWQAAWIIINQTAPPKSPPLWAEFLPLLARVGGGLGRKSDGPPGAKTIQCALRRIHDFVIALNYAKNIL